MRTPIAPLLGLAILLPLAACNRTSPETRAEANRAAAATKEAGRKAGDALSRAGKEVASEAKKLEKAAQPTAEDLALSAKIKAKLAADPQVSALHVDVSTDKGVVTLTGTVDGGAERDEAVAVARRTEGVKTVIDRLTTAGQAATTPTP